MKFANKLSDQEIINFIEKQFDVKVEWLNLDIKTMPCGSANIKLKNIKHPINFTFSDFVFNCDEIKAKTTKEHTYKCWNIFLYNKFGICYAESLNEYLNQKIICAKQQAQQKIDSANYESTNFIGYLLAQVENINKQINAEQTHRREQIDEIKMNLYQKIGEINSFKITKDKELEKEI